MKPFIVSDDIAQGEKIRQLVANEDLDCPSSNILPIAKAVHVLTTEKPELVVVVLEPNPERALAVIMAAKGRSAPHVIAIGPEVDARLVLRVLRGGADDYVDSKAVETELKEAVRRWRSKLQETLASGRIISMLATNGGCGVSTLATNMAVALGQSGERVLLVDLQHRTDDLASLLDLKPTYSIANLCASITGMDRALFEKALTPHESGVQLLAPPRRAEDIASVTPACVCQVMALARSAFPFVVVDMDLTSDQTMQEVLIQSDLILLVLKPDVLSLRNAKRLLDRLEWLGIAQQQVRTILSRVGQPGEVPVAKVEAALRTKAFQVIPEDLKVVNNCNNMGVPVIKEAPRSRYTYAINGLVAAVRELLPTARPIPVRRPAPATAPASMEAVAIPEAVRPTPAFQA